MTTIRFGRSPAFVVIGEGLRLAAGYWRASTERWVLAVAAVALAQGLAGWLLGGSTLDQQTMGQVLFPGRVSIDPAAMPRLFAGPLATAIIGIVAQWFLVANAIVGLRGRPMTLGWVLTSGLRSLVADLLVALTFGALLVVLLALGPVGLLALLAVLPVLLYVGLRMQFWTLAIFDGQGIQAGLVASWSITRRSVLRVLGWGAVMFAIGLLLAIADTAIDVALGAAPAVASFVTGAIDASFSAFGAIVLAILYESQRLRSLGQPATPYPVYRPAPSPGWAEHSGAASSPQPSSPQALPPQSPPPGSVPVQPETPPPWPTSSPPEAPSSWPTSSPADSPEPDAHPGSRVDPLGRPSEPPPPPGGAAREPFPTGRPSAADSSGVSTDGSPSPGDR